MTSTKLNFPSWSVSMAANAAASCGPSSSGVRKPSWFLSRLLNAAAVSAAISSSVTKPSPLLSAALKLSSRAASSTVAAYPPPAVPKITIEAAAATSASRLMSPPRKGHPLMAQEVMRLPATGNLALRSLAVPVPVSRGEAEPGVEVDGGLVAGLHLEVEALRAWRPRPGGARSDEAPRQALAAERRLGAEREQAGERAVRDDEAAGRGLAAD